MAVSFLLCFLGSVLARRAGWKSAADNPAFYEETEAQPVAG